MTFNFVTVLQTAFCFCHPFNPLYEEDYSYGN